MVQFGGRHWCASAESRSSRGLGHRPFKAATRVRIPSGIRPEPCTEFGTGPFHALRTPSHVTTLPIAPHPPRLLECRSPRHRLDTHCSKSIPHHLHPESISLCSLRVNKTALRTASQRESNTPSHSAFEPQSRTRFPFHPKTLLYFSSCLRQRSGLERAKAP